VNGQEIVRGVFDSVLMVNLTEGNFIKWFHTWHERLSWWSRGSQIATVPRVEANSFGLKLYHIWKKNGVNHMINRMKIMLYVVNAFLGGRKVTSTADLGFRIRLRNGLPAVLPLFVRNGIRTGNKHYIHIWTSILFSYKGILGTWKVPRLDDSSITAPHPNISGKSDFFEFTAWISLLWEQLRYVHQVRKPDLKVKTPFFTTKAGPNSPISILGAGFDAYLWYAADPSRPAVMQGDVKDNPDIDGKLDHHTGTNLYQATAGVSRNLIREWVEATDQKDLWQSIRKTAKMFSLQYQLSMKLADWATVEVVGTSAHNRKGLGKFTPNWAKNIMGQNNPLLRFKEPTLQRLHNLCEAAGKVRTIAIVDYWTNYVLKPLHDWMFKILQCLPQDATFDQEGRVNEFAQRGYTYVYSYDLKNATDRIPIALYKALFKPMLGEFLTNLWIDLLVDRDFLCPKDTRELPAHPRRVRYRTGQPMGALTSWASMALVHHALVLYAAFRAGRTNYYTLLNFIDYLVLGDDIVIADSAVAREYINLMKAFEIPVSLAKSHISHIGMFNFANQTFVANRNVSPLSMREDLNAVSLPTRVEFALRMARRGWMDLTSRTWAITLMKKFFSHSVWVSTIEPLVRQRKTHPVIQWIIAVLLTPGTTRFGFAGLSIDLDVFLGAQLLKGKFWSTRVTQLYKFLDRRRSEPLLVSLLGKWVDNVYRQFLENRNRFLGFDRWVSTVVTVDIEWLVRTIFEGARKEAFDRWTNLHRLPLKEVQIATHTPGINSKELAEIATGHDFNDLITKVAEAEKDLPLVPEFSNENLDVIHSVETGEAAAGRIYRSQLQSLLRVTQLLQMVDHLGPTGTPGFVKPGNISQSSVPDVSPTDK
jgi:hypothetical protein